MVSVDPALRWQECFSVHQNLLANPDQVSVVVERSTLVAHATERLCRWTMTYAGMFEMKSTVGVRCWKTAGRLIDVIDGAGVVDLSSKLTS